MYRTALLDGELVEVLQIEHREKPELKYHHDPEAQIAFFYTLPAGDFAQIHEVDEDRRGKPIWVRLSELESPEDKNK